MSESIDPKGTIRIALDEGPAFRLELERGYRRLTVTIVPMKDDLVVRARGLDGQSGANFFESRVKSSEDLFLVLEWLDGQLEKWPLS